MGWDWNDLDALGPPARQQIVQQLEQRLARGRDDPATTATIKAQLAHLRASLAKPASAPTGGTTTRPAAPTAGRVRVPRRPTDIGDLYEPTTRALQRPGSTVIQIIDTIELTNQHSGRHAMVTHQVEKRWTALMVRVCADWCVQPLHGPVTLTVWHLRDRVKSRGQCPDWDAARYPLKGAVDGLVMAGVLPDDGPGYLRHAHLVEAVLSDTEGLVFVLEPSGPLPAFPKLPSLTVPHHD